MNKHAVVQKADTICVNAAGALMRGYHFPYPETMDGDEKTFVFSGLLQLCLNAFEHEKTEAFADDVRDHLFGCDHLYVLRSDGTFTAGEIGAPRPMAFAVWNEHETEEGRVMYLSGICVGKEWQGHGIGKALLQKILDTAPYDHICMVTQNPVMKLSLDKALGKESNPSDWLWRTRYETERFAALLGKADILNRQTGVLEGNYPDPLYKQRPTSRDNKYNFLFSFLDHERGDAYLCHAEV